MTVPFSPVSCAPGNRNFYIGPPGGLVMLTVPDASYTNTLDNNRVQHDLLAGSHAIQRVNKTRRTYGIAHSALTADTADLIVSISHGLLGPGPYYFVDPMWRNVLSAGASACGQTRQNSSAFYLSGGGTVAYSGTVNPPKAAPLSGVQLVTGGVSGSVLWIGATAPGVVEASGPPVVPGLPISCGVWLQTSTGTVNVSVSLFFVDINGSNISSVSVGAGTVTTAWARFGGPILPAAIPAAAVAVSMSVTFTSKPAGTVAVAAADMQYTYGTINATDPTAALAPWVLGLGVPKMLISGTTSASAAPTFWRRNMAITLVEAT